VVLEIGLDAEVFDGRDHEERAEQDQDCEVAPKLAHRRTNWPGSIELVFQILFLRIIQVHIGMATLQLAFLSYTIV